jgi:hypothetical protein
LNIKTFIGITRRLFTSAFTKKPVTAKRIVSYIIDILLLIVIITLAVTGLINSKVVIPTDNFSRPLATFHMWTAFTMAGLVLIHFIFHFKYFTAIAKKTVTDLKKPIAQVAFGSALAIIIALGTANFFLITMFEKRQEELVMGLLDDDLVEEYFTEPEVAPFETGAELSEYLTSQVSKNPNWERIIIPPPESMELPKNLKDYMTTLKCGICGLECDLSYPLCGAASKLIELARDTYLDKYGFDAPSTTDQEEKTAESNTEDLVEPVDVTKTTNLLDLLDELFK